MAQVTFTQIAIIAACLLIIVGLPVWLTHEYREAEKRMVQRINDRRRR